MKFLLTRPTITELKDIWNFY